jgi:DNA-binding transcriptional MerR regulator
MALMHIGEVARRTGLSVKTVRYYSDLGLVPEASRTAAGYRRYDQDALVRLQFVRTLRELGLELAAIRRVLRKETALCDVAAAHAEAIGAQIRLLRIQRAALRALTRRQLNVKEVDIMNGLAQATAEERRRIIDEFLDAIFAGVDVSAEFAERMRTGAPELPDDPSDAQIDAWIELAELVADSDFRQRLQAMGRRTFGTTGAPARQADRRPATPTGPEAMRTAALVVERAGAARSAGVDPASPAADAVHDELVAAFAASVGRQNDPTYRHDLAASIELGREPRAERYWQLVAVINGWPPIPSTMPAWDWFHEAVTARL